MSTYTAWVPCPTPNNKHHVHLHRLGPMPDPQQYFTLFALHIPSMRRPHTLLLSELISLSNRLGSSQDRPPVSTGESPAFHPSSGAGSARSHLAPNPNPSLCQAQLQPLHLRVSAIRRPLRYVVLHGGVGTITAQVPIIIIDLALPSAL